MKIQAKAAMEKGQKLVDYSYEEEALSSDDIHIEVQACGICYSDIHMIDNDWKNSTYPLVPGHEIVGIVKDKGDLVNHLSVGDRVGIGWQRSACHECRNCLAGYENYCKVAKQDTIVNNHGGFSHNLVFDSRFAFKLPGNLQSHQAAPLFCGGITVYSALKHAGMTSGQRVGVIGIGGLGHLAVQFATKLGNEVTIFTTSPDKAEMAHQLGATNAIITKDEVPKPDNNMLDVVINTVDIQLDWSKYIRYLDVDGTMTFVGSPGNIEVSIPRLMSNRRRIMGSSIGGRSNMVEMLDIASRFNVEAIIEKFEFDNVNEALDRVRKGDIRYRAVLDF